MFKILILFDFIEFIFNQIEYAFKTVLFMCIKYAQ